jgi:hypothetical protein
MVELDDAVRRHQRVVVGQRDDARAELDALRALGRRGDEDLRRGDNLEARGVMLADPSLLVAEPVQPFDEFEIAADRQRRIFLGRVEGCEEYPAAQQWFGHRLFSPAVALLGLVA